ncbi:alpha/beta hydrolase [Spirillospora sp. NPDC048911]|uniref:alpha/beta hydrolase n=1 Tax=Spirillospora sp. NPDC048911 TaxID=3364527 RepID=UPI003711A0BB
MSLIGWPLVCLLIAAAVAVLVATVWGWGRLGGRGLRFVIGRLALFGLCQLLVLASVLALINRQFAFYATWSELTGIGRGGDGPGVIQNRGPAGALTGAKVIKLKPEFSVGGDPAKDGSVESVDIQGARSGLRGRGYVYLPPQYFQPGAEQKRFPVVLALSGYPGAVRNLVTQLKVPQTASKEIKAGQIQPTIYVLMRPALAGGRDTECMDVPGGPQAATFFAQDLPEAISSQYRTSPSRTGWGVFGLSTGGYCSLKLAMRHSSVFAAAASISGYYGAIKDVTTGELYGGSQAVRDENDLFWRLRNLPPPPVAVLVTTSKVGEQNRAGTERFLSLVKPPMQASSITLDTGGHNFGTWNQVLPPVMRWMSQRLTP